MEKNYNIYLHNHHKNVTPEIFLLYREHKCVFLDYMNLKFFSLQNTDTGLKNSIVITFLY